MTILVIDDQISVVSGIIFGIQWDKIGVERVLKAYNAYEAKEVLKNHEVDIMLCDIEMPAENGLNLFKWVVEQKMKTECIFLTAHADFIYAKEAIRLGSFDYILQPARYEDIKNTVKLAMKKIKSKRKKEEYYSYGEMLYKHKEVLLENQLREWFYGKKPDYNLIIRELDAMEIRLRLDSSYHVNVVQIQSWNLSVENWEFQLLRNTMNNIVTELFKNYGQRVLLLQINKEDYIFVNYSIEGEDLDETIQIRLLEQLIHLYSSYYQCKISCYTDISDKIENVHVIIAQLLNRKSQNVLREGKVYHKENLVLNDKNEKIDSSCEELGKLLQHGAVKEFCDGSIAKVDCMVSCGEIKFEELLNFYHNFMYEVYSAAEKSGIFMEDFFSGEEERRLSVEASLSVEKMKELIYGITSFFETATLSEEKEHTIIDQILQYIRSNVEKDIRRDDIANAVYLNPNYVSRLFKSKMGISLKEYIIKEKMKLANTLVKSTDLSISVIAVKVGYFNFSHFSQVYKKMLGVTPIEDRNRNNN